MRQRASRVGPARARLVAHLPQEFDYLLLPKAAQDHAEHRYALGCRSPDGAPARRRKQQAPRQPLAPVIAGRRLRRLRALTSASANRHRSVDMVLSGFLKGILVDSAASMIRLQNLTLAWPSAFARRRRDVLTQATKPADRRQRRQQICPVSWRLSADAGDCLIPADWRVAPSPGDRRGRAPGGGLRTRW